MQNDSNTDKTKLAYSTCYGQLSVYDGKKLGGDRCWYCAEYIPNGSYRRTADHFWPKHMKGRLKVVCCKNCNDEKKGLTPNGFIEHLNKLKAKQPYYASKFDRMINATVTLWERVKWSV